MASVENNKSVRDLTRKRGAIKSKLTAFIKFVESCTDADPSRISQLGERTTRLQADFDAFEQYQQELELLAETDEIYESRLTERHEFEDAYYDSLARARTILNEQGRGATSVGPSPQTPTTSAINPSEPQVVFNQSPPAIAQLPQVHSPLTVVSESYVKLPTMHLPKFSGSYEAWPGFSDAFKSAVHDNPTFRDAQKLVYLKSCLVGRAAEKVESLETTAANYMVAWNMLDNYYNDPTILIENRIKALFNLPPCMRPNERTLGDLTDSATKHYNALKALNQPFLEAFPIYAITSKLDEQTRRSWKERTQGSTTLPTMEELLKFLHLKRKILEGSTPEPSIQPINRAPANPKLYKRFTVEQKNHTRAFAAQQASCYLCKGTHFTQYCEKLTSVGTNERIRLVQKAKLCTNCLRSNHDIKSCTAGCCKQCNEKHHTLLHQEPPKEQRTTIANVSSLNAYSGSETILSTAIIQIRDSRGRFHSCRALLDSGSQSHFLTHAMVKKLGLTTEKLTLPVIGINQQTSHITSKTQTEIKSRINKFNTQLTFLILPKITENLPMQPITRAPLRIPANIPLADPSFHIPSDIDALLGAEIFLKLLCVGQISLANDTLTLQKTKLGWILAGKPPSNNLSTTIRCHVSRAPLDSQIAKFWELESIPSKPTLSRGELAAENHYTSNITRDTHTGQYIARLPFKEKVPALGESYSTALRRFRALERTLSKDSDRKHQYTNFLREYRELNHMSEIESDCTGEGYYLPHHAILKQSSITTKLRVVFDASAKTSNNLSLNDTLLVGPTIQEDLYSLLIRFRTHAYVLTADIEKMYRQISIDPRDRLYQKILWREDSQQPIKTYTLNTVTYGTSAAPFLAIRTLHQLANDEGNRYPMAAKILRNDFYVDDLLTGASSYDEAIAIRDQLITICLRGGFKLRQWASNDVSLIKTLDDKTNATHLRLDLDDTVKALGIQWSPKLDNISYVVKEPILSSRVTKRIILSQIATLFDPLGLLGPVIIRAKILMQTLWKLELEWDESVPTDIYSAWQTYTNELQQLHDIKIPRITMLRNYSSIQLHGFCDASTQAYGACIYLRTKDHEGNVMTRLISSKSRVAPLKTVTLPRLELCAAHLLAKLYATTKQALRHLSFLKIVFWSDSTIALHWIKTAPHMLKTFVAHRVADIQTTTASNDWRHIRSEDNPADLVSRGISVGQFNYSNLWHNGPCWLANAEGDWPSSCLEPIEVPELRAVIALPVQPIQLPYFQRFSSFQRLKRVTAYLLRFVENASRRKRISGPLSADELQRAEQRIVSLIQSNSYAAELTAIKKSQPPRHLTPLSPFIDSDGILRVGGRLRRTNLPYDSKHPILIPRDHHVTKLIIRDTHERNFHTGNQATLNAIRHKYWVPNGKGVIRKIIHKCIVCYRAKPRESNYIMSDLPKSRLTYTRPFLHAGIDFCGPFLIKEKTKRNRGKVKVFLAVFVCFSTRAIHIEIVGDLTTDSCLAALRRFFARRGKCSDIYSDNATNFVGAKRELKELFALVQSGEYNRTMSEQLANENVNWHMIPPRSPHFGGIWEAAVKAAKHHITRTIGETLLSYEGFLTYVNEIEAILNSRPLCPLSTDPNDLTALTPGHFLIGDRLTGIPDHDFLKLPSGRLSSWQHIQQLRQHFWKRWSNEYLQTLISRKKWHTGEATNLTVGSMVIVKEDNIPPMQWPLGRIIAVHPGKDGIIRVVTVKTSVGEYTRCVKRIAPLPIDA